MNENLTDDIMIKTPTPQRMHIKEMFQLIILLRRLYYKNKVKK